jgi:alkyl sulfatase BDS1-like metallo-beta-lactamase superfamily hydrolase
MMAMSLDQLFDVCAVKLIAENLVGREALIEVEVTDRNEPVWRLHLSHRSLHARPMQHHVANSTVSAIEAEAQITLEYATLAAMASAEVTVSEAIAQGTLQLRGSQQAVELIFGNLDVFQNNFPIVEP